MKWVRRPQKSMRKNDCGFKNEGKKEFSNLGILGKIILYKYTSW